MYYPGLAPRGGNTEDLRQYIETELGQLSAILQAMQVPFVQLAPRYVAPEKPREGLVVFADGTSWNPGSGKGVYVYASSAWVKL